MRVIKLTKPLRTEILTNVMRAWAKENPRPEVKLPYAHSQLVKLDTWRAARQLQVTQTTNLLNSFSTLTDATTHWPDIAKFFPSYMLEPAKYSKLPKKAA